MRANKCGSPWVRSNHRIYENDYCTEYTGSDVPPPFEVKRSQGALTPSELVDKTWDALIGQTISRTRRHPLPKVGEAQNKQVARNAYATANFARNAHAR